MMHLVLKKWLLLLMVIDEHSFLQATLVALCKPEPPPPPLLSPLPPPQPTLMPAAGRSSRVGILTTPVYLDYSFVTAFLIVPIKLMKHNVQVNSYARCSSFSLLIRTTETSAKIKNARVLLVCMSLITQTPSVLLKIVVPELWETSIYCYDLK